MSTASVTSVKDELKIDTWQKMKQGSESMCRKKSGWPRVANEFRSKMLRGVDRKLSEEVSFNVTVFSMLITKLIIRFCRTGSRSEERPVIIRGGPTDGVIVSGARVRGSVRLRLSLYSRLLVPGRIADSYVLLGIRLFCDLYNAITV
jgi:hypothetical protein